jgi:ribosome biogenesis protein BMS1
VLVDRVEDVTSNVLLQENPNCNRDVTLCGYVRGTHLKASSLMHLIGAGDYEIASITKLEDPCPLPQSSDSDRKVSLKAKDSSQLYAPMANVGRVVVDKDGMYIDIKNIHYTKPENLQLGAGQSQSSMDRMQDGYDEDTPIGLLRRMQDAPQVDKMIDDAELSLFPGQDGVKSAQVISDDDYEEDKDRDDGDDDNDDEEEDEDGEYDSDAEEDDNDDEADDDDGDYDDDDDEAYDDDDDDDDDDVAKEHDGNLKWKDNMKSKATEAFYSRMNGSDDVDLMSQVYGSSWNMKAKSLSKAFGVESKSSFHDDEEDEDEEDELFQVASSSKDRHKHGYEMINTMDSSRVKYDSRRITIKSANAASISRGRAVDEMNDSLDDRIRSIMSDIKQMLRSKQRICKEGQKGMNTDDEAMDDEDVDDVNQDEDMDVDGDFEDLETGQVYGHKSYDQDEDDNDDDDNDGDEEEEDDDVDSELANDEIDRQLREANARRKSTSRQQFNQEYDTGKFKSSKNSANDKPDADGIDVADKDDEEVLETAQRLQEERRRRNKEEFGEDGEQARIAHEGYRAGLYVRILIRNVPKEFSANFQPSLPVILGGLGPQEMSLGIIRARVIRHRWHKKILKSNDPLIFSIGWRRFQSLPIYCIEDQNERDRFLKYTPEHMHCIAYFYGPLVPPNTPLMGFQKASSTTLSFRIALTGTALEMTSTPSIVKKLKLIGYPNKVLILT